MKDETVVGHIPKKIPSICSLYLRRGGSIICRVTGSRRYSEDLIQGRLKIPCVLIFKGGITLMTKACAAQCCIQRVSQGLNDLAER